MLHKLIPYLKKPVPYEKGTSELWRDEHISKGMLEAHLDSAQDGATRNFTFVRKSMNWISGLFPSDLYPNLIDLGCGPGIYAEMFYEKGYHVTGIDFSERSIKHAMESAEEKGLHIEYVMQDYLKLSYEEQFEIATMIYCDFGVLSDRRRNVLLENIYRALKPGGVIIFDVFTPYFYKKKPESRIWSYCETGFFSETPYINMETFYRYDDCNTFLDQYIIITDNSIQCHNLWNHGFMTSELKNSLSAAGFCKVELYGDISGAPLHPEGVTICVVARKGA